MVLNFEYRHAKIHLEFVHAPTLRDTIVSDNYVVSHLASVPSTLTSSPSHAPPLILDLHILGASCVWSGLLPLPCPGFPSVLLVLVLLFLLTSAAIHGPGTESIIQMCSLSHIKHPDIWIP